MNSGPTAGARDPQPATASLRPAPRAGDPGDRELVLVLTTEASQERADQLATTLLERGLVACVSLLPIVSHYRWEGQLTRGAEVQLLLKTDPQRLEELHGAVMALHSYDTPEWITLQARTRGGYGLWCAAQLSTEPLRADAGPPTPPGSLEGVDPAG
ncbi:MAG: divalent-cation tolerance protein CutA [Cyanobacteriota bacterium]|nr:divalent-cation tolerance protein CutA [Cyanobacteriota bacterium]